VPESYDPELLLLLLLTDTPEEPRESPEDVLPDPEEDDPAAGPPPRLCPQLETDVTTTNAKTRAYRIRAFMAPPLFSKCSAHNSNLVYHAAAYSNKFNADCPEMLSNLSNPIGLMPSDPF
jgi:hypothetical protein